MTEEREATQAEMRQILGMPPEDFEDFEALEKMLTFRDLSDQHEGLFKTSDAARLLGITSSCLRAYIASGTAKYVEMFGSKWILGTWIKDRILNPPGPGRPKKRDKVDVSSMSFRD